MLESWERDIPSQKAVQIPKTPHKTRETGKGKKSFKKHKRMLGRLRGKGSLEQKDCPGGGVGDFWKNTYFIS